MVATVRIHTYILFLHTYLSLYAEMVKSSRTCLIGYAGFISREWFLIAWGWTHTHMYTHTCTHTHTCTYTHTHAYTHTHIHTHTLTYQLPGHKQFQETRCSPGLKIVAAKN